MIADTVANDVQAVFIACRLIPIEPRPVFWRAVVQHFLALIVPRPLGVCPVGVVMKVLKAMQAAASCSWRSRRWITTLASHAGSDFLTI